MTFIWIFVTIASIFLMGGCLYILHSDHRRAKKMVLTPGEKIKYLTPSTPTYGTLIEDNGETVVIQISVGRHNIDKLENN